MGGLDLAVLTGNVVAGKDLLIRCQQELGGGRQARLAGVDDLQQLGLGSHAVGLLGDGAHGSRHHGLGAPGTRAEGAGIVVAELEWLARELLVYRQVICVGSSEATICLDGVKMPELHCAMKPLSPPAWMGDDAGEEIATAARTRDEHVTIDDVARASGLSVATVSRVMHDNPRVSHETSLRVREAIDRLGYTPNALARGLSMRVTHTVGVLVISISDPFWGEVVHGIEDRARLDRYAVLLASTDEDVGKERQALELFRHQRVDGIIIGASSTGIGAVGDWRPPRQPIVFVNNEHLPTVLDRRFDVEPRTASVIATDDRQGARLAVEHLIDLGHKRIAYIGSSDRASSVLRLQGYHLALKASGTVPDESLILTVAEGANHGELATLRLLARTPAPTALFCYDDMMALGALRAIRALKLRVPRDISVVGYDDIPLAAYLEPPLTTVRQPMNEMGRQAMSILLAVLRGEREPITSVLGGELVVRDSSGPAPA